MANIKDEPTNDVKDTNPEMDEFAGNPVNVGFHPLGGISVSVRSINGDVAQARITVDQAWTTVGHLLALTGMLIQGAYAQMMQQTTEPEILLPRR